MASRLPFPSIYLLPVHLSQDEILALEMQIPNLSRDASKANLFVGKLSKRERAQFELRRLGVNTSDRSPRRPAQGLKPPHSSPQPITPSPKRRKTGGGEEAAPIVISSDSSSDESVEEVDSLPPTQVESQSQPQTQTQAPSQSQTQSGSQALIDESSTSTIKVVRLAWFTDSLARKRVLPLARYIVYEGDRIQPAASSTSQQTQPSQTAPTPSKTTPNSADRTAGILQRARADAAAVEDSGSSPARKRYRRTSPTLGKRPTLTRTSTSEDDEASTALPPIPDYLQTTYSCQRPTPEHPPNEAFVDVLKKIRDTRHLIGDQIGIRAYSSAIASLAAYPYALKVPAEVARLPGCGPKIAELYREFSRRDGHVHEVEDAEADPKLCSLRLFCGIWGVAEATARSFYNRGWRDLDNVVEFGWPELSRVQQIGVKYYDELHERLTRVQQEHIAHVVLQHADRIRPGFQMLIGGGYRRGQERSKDVDVLLSHRDPEATHGLISLLVQSLQQDGYVTHTLTLGTTNSERDQEPISWKGHVPRPPMAHSSDGGAAGGLGFDTLDKALVVWQYPAGEGNESSSKETESQSQSPSQSLRNRNPHRRVDIVVTPWKTVGCAVLGWSGGTTFQRDLRRYCKKEKGLRFDSSGARSTVDGSWVDLENYTNDPAPDMLTAERRVFAALDLEWRAPDERCTG